jgi:transcriptional regulator with XRE-family HTH domain
MDNRQAFGKALQQIRKARGLTQEDFSNISSRTYMSTLEHGKKSPTLDKVEALSNELKVHPLTLLTLTYLNTRKNKNPGVLLARIERELRKLIAGK